MNNWNNEFMAEFHRQQILSDAEQIRLETIAVKSRVYRPGILERIMFHFANWMIETGKELRKRYELPSVPCNSCPTGSFAQ